MVVVYIDTVVNLRHMTKTGFFSLLLAASSVSAFRPHSDSSRRQFLGGVTSTDTSVAFVQPLFRQTFVTRHDVKRNDPLHALETNDLECRIDEVLTRRSQELLDELGDEQTAREALLSSRLSGLNFLDRSEVRASDIPGAGRGLFATEDVPCGEVIT